MALIYMVTAITHERYSVVAGTQKVRSEKEKRKMVAIYLAIVLVPTIIFNLPKFFEVSWRQAGEVALKVVTPMRTNRYYSIFYVCWTRLIFCHALPFSFLVYFSFNIYQGPVL